MANPGTGYAIDQAKTCRGLGSCWIAIQVCPQSAVTSGKTYGESSLVNRLVLAGICALGALTSGCASMTNPAYQSVIVQSVAKAGGEVIGAACEMNNDKGRWLVTTPASVMVQRSNKDMQVSCSKTGVDAGTATVVSRLTTAMYGNILVGGGIGAALDHVNGSAYEYPSLIQMVMGSFSNFDLAKTPGDRQESVVAKTASLRAPTLQDDECRRYVSAGEKCWWSPPGAPSNGLCPTVPELAECTRYYGRGCRIGHGTSLPAC